jgi:three-Cys-motif partner protein
MVKHDAFFDVNKKAAALLKHAVLRRYLATFTARLGSTSLGHRVGFVDGYAGPGTYVNLKSGVVSSGSPKIALDIAANLIARDRHLECIFVEQNKGIFRRLQALVAEAETPAQAWSGDISDHLATALQQLAGVPTLVFLDPFGAPVDIGHTVDTILRRPGQVPTELLLNFSMDAMRRIGGRLLEATDASGREKTLARADAWLGGDWWRPYFTDLPKPAPPDAIDTAASDVAREYNRRVGAATGCSSFTIPIRRRAHHKPIFMLTLFFPRAIAAFAYNEAVSLALQEWRREMSDLEVNDAARRQEREGSSLGDESPEELRYILDAAAKQFDIDLIDDIVLNLRSQLAEHAALSVDRQMQLVFGPSLGAAREMHLRRAWKQLHAEGLVADPPPRKLEHSTIRKASSARFQ